MTCHCLSPPMCERTSSAPPVPNFSYLNVSAGEPARTMYGQAGPALVATHRWSVDRDGSDQLGPALTMGRAFDTVSQREKAGGRTASSRAQARFRLGPRCSHPIAPRSWSRRRHRDLSAYRSYIGGKKTPDM